MSENDRLLNGFSLLEVTFAIAITAFCLVALLGLLPAAQRSDETASGQAGATNLLSAVESDLRNTPLLGNAVSPVFGVSVPAAGADNSATSFFVTADGLSGGPNREAVGNERYRVSIWLLPARSAGSKEACGARILISWPASADPDPARTPRRFSGSLETFTSLDRS